MTYDAKDAFLQNIQSSEAKSDEQQQPTEAAEQPTTAVDDTPRLDDTNEAQSNDLDQEQADQPDSEENVQESEQEVSTTEEPLDVQETTQQSIEIGGISYTKEELESGLMMQSDYTRKTQELAAQRKALENEQERAAAALGLLTQQAAQEAQQYQQLDWQRLAQEDPAQYTKMRTAADHAEANLKDTRHKVDQFFQRIEAAKGEELQERAQNCVKSLKATNPDWSNALYYQLVEDGVKQYGFTKDELLQQTDPRMFQMLIDARKYQQGRKIATEKTANLSPKKTLQQSVKSDATPSKEIANKRRAQESIRQLEKSHSVKDAQAAFYERLR